MTDEFLAAARRLLGEAGISYDIRRLNGGHRAIIVDGRNRATFPMTASDHHAIKNFAADLKRIVREKLR